MVKKPTLRAQLDALRAENAELRAAFRDVTKWAEVKTRGEKSTLDLDGATLSSKGSTVELFKKLWEER